MKVPRAIHRWDLSPRQAICLQRRLAELVRPAPLRGELPARGKRGLAPSRVRLARSKKACREVPVPFCHGLLRLVAGGDATIDPTGEYMIAGWVVWDVQTREAVESVVAVRPVRFPYVPGLLSFREAPVLIAAARKLSCEPDVFMLDGQGLAHPRRFGLACHVGVLLDRPSFGCAKSLLCGTPQRPTRGRESLGITQQQLERIAFQAPDLACLFAAKTYNLLSRGALVVSRQLPLGGALANEAGAWCPLVDKGETIGRVLRTRPGVKPVYVSVGHRITLDDAVAVTLRCCAGHRLPEPSRLAHQLVTQARRLQS